jgi:hypothetical protein
VWLRHGLSRLQPPAAAGVEAGPQQDRFQSLVEPADGALVDGQPGVGHGQLA